MTRQRESPSLHLHDRGLVVIARSFPIRLWTPLTVTRPVAFEEKGMSCPFGCRISPPTHDAYDTTARVSLLTSARKKARRFHKVSSDLKVNTRDHFMICGQQQKSWMSRPFKSRAVSSTHDTFVTTTRVSLQTFARKKARRLRKVSPNPMTNTYDRHLS
jgi:hypothetical protein